MRSAYLGLAMLFTCPLFVACVPDLSSGERPSPGDCPTPETWYHWTDDGAQHYVAEIGSGPPVVVLHGGWGAEHSYLLDVVLPHAGDFRFVLYDQRGSLRSPAPDGTIRLDRLVGDLEELREELGLQRLTLLTHSMGAQLAYAYLREHPQRVGGMVLLAAVLPADAPTDERSVADAQRRFVEFAQANEARQAALEGLDRTDLSDRERSARAQISFASGNLFHVARWRKMKGGQAFYNGRLFPLLQRNSPESAWRGLYAAWREHAPPSVVILGDHDLVDFGLVSWPGLAESLPHVELKILERAGHNAWIDRPEQLRTILGRALARLAAAGGS